jgi:hypothetical protein
LIPVAAANETNKIHDIFLLVKSFLLMGSIVAAVGVVLCVWGLLRTRSD